MDLTRLREDLSRIRPGAHIRHLFGALQEVVPLDACVVQSFRATQPHHISFASYQLPTSVADAWLLDGEANFSMTLAPLVKAPPGALLNDTAHTAARVRDKVPVYGAMSQAGLHQRSALVLLPRTVGGAVEHRFLALLSRRRTPGGANIERALSSLHEEISCAADNIISPHDAMGAMFTTYVYDRAIGYAFLDDAGAVLMSNTRAHDLAVHYSDMPPASSFTALQLLVRDAREYYREQPVRPYGHQGNQCYMRYEPSLTKLLLVSVHSLKRDEHSLAENWHFVMLEEVEWDPVAHEPSLLRKSELSPRQREVANWLISTKLTAAEIAARMDIGTRTVESHTRKVYKAFGVRSREDLRRLLLQSSNMNSADK